VPVVFAGRAGDADDLASLAVVPGVEVAQACAFDQRTLGLARARR
jgi:hypothetical protein